MAPYRPSGSRSHRSGRNQAEQEVFEGLPVKQWTPQYTRQSLVPPAQENETHDPDDKWNREPPMPRDAHMLQPWTFELLRLARSGKIGRKRKPVEIDDDGEQVEGPEALEGEGVGNGGAVGGNEERRGSEDKSFVVKKWRPVSEHALVPEHRHLEFLAKRRKGLPSIYGGGEVSSNPAVSMRKTRVQRIDAISGEMVLYEVLVPEGTSIDGEVIVGMDSEVDSKPSVSVTSGTVVEGLGVANEDGILVAEHLRPSVAPRRNRPPPKKKGGPGRGKKRVTFTNPDGTTYTTIVPNATKIIPQPGQTVKHVAKGEEAVADVSAAQAAATAATTQTPTGGQGEDEGGDDDGSDDEDGEDEDDDREEGEVSDNDAPQTAAGTPARSTPARTDSSNGTKKEKEEEVKVAPTSVPPTMEEVQQEVQPEVAKDTEMSDYQPTENTVEQLPEKEEIDREENIELKKEQNEIKTENQTGDQKEEPKASRSTSSSPEVSLAKVASAGHSRQNSLTEPPNETITGTAEEAEAAPTEQAPQGNTNIEDETGEKDSEASPEKAVSEYASEAVPEAVPETVSEAVTEAVPEAIPEAIAESAPEAVMEAAPIAESDVEPKSTPKAEKEAATDSDVKEIQPSKDDIPDEPKPEEQITEPAKTEEVEAKAAEEKVQEEEKEGSPVKKLDSDGDVGMGDAGPENTSKSQEANKEDEGDDLLGGLEADLQEQKKDDEK